MDVLDPRCAGLDVHAQTVVGCIRITAGATVRHERRTVATTTRGRLELLDWLTGEHVTHVAMEATGVYWRPVWHVLEGRLTLVLANAMHIRTLPGRKRDQNDATWIADRLALGLIRSSFVPPLRCGTCATSPERGRSWFVRPLDTRSASRRPSKTRTSS